MPTFMNRVLLAAIAAIMASTIGCSTPATHPTGPMLDELMRKSGLWNQLAQIEPMMQVGVTQAHEQSPRIPEENLDQLRAAIASAYAVDDLRTSVRDQLLATVSPQDATTVLRWLSSDLGQRITALEEAGSTPEAAVKRQDEGPQVLADLPPQRRQQVERLVKLTFSAEVAADLVIDTTVGVARGIALSANVPVPDSIETLKSKLQSQRAQLVDMLGPRLAADYAIVYLPLSDKELEQYIEFCESPAGQRYAAAGVDAIDKALTEAAVRLGHRLVDTNAGLAQPPREPRLPNGTIALAGLAWHGVV